MDKKELETILERGIYQALRQVLKKLGIYFAIGWLSLLIVGWISGNYDKDDTDGVDRSGMVPHTDNLTGCQYLSVSGGGIIQRVNAQGIHIGCRKYL